MATQDRGMIYRSDSVIKIQHNGDNESNYKRVLPGQFVIHLRSFQGGFAHSENEGICSPAYTVFGFKEAKNHNDIFWKYFFSSKKFIKALESITYGIRDGRSISNDEFLKMKLFVPSINEQTRIGSQIRVVNYLITLHQRKPFSINSALIKGASPSRYPDFPILG